MTVGDVSQTELKSVSVRKEGQLERIALGLSNAATILDAREVQHQFRVSRHGDWCRICGLNDKAEIHL